MRTLLIAGVAASLAACHRAPMATSPGMNASAGPPAIARIYYWRARPGKVAEYSRYICQLAEPIDHEAQRHGAFVSVTTMLAPDTTGAWTHVRMFKLRDSTQLAGLSKALDDAGIAIEPDSAKRRARGTYSASLRDAAGSETLTLPTGDITALHLPGLGGRPIREGASPCAS